MPPVAAVLLAWSAIAIYAGLFHGALAYYRPQRANGHLAYALLCATHVGYSYGLAMAARAESPEAATAGTALVSASGLLMGAAFFQLAVTITLSRLARLAPAAWISMAVGAVAMAIGLGVHVPSELVLQRAGLGIDAPRIRVSLTLLGGVFVFGALAWSALGLATLFRRARDETEARVVLAVSFPAIAVSVHQVVSRLGESDTGWLTDLTPIPIALGAGLVLLRRFARSATSLGAHNRALERSYEQLRRTQEALVRKEQLAAVGELSAVIAHEVRNPLAILKNAVSGLRQRALGEGDRRVLLGIVNEETDRLARLVRDLLAYARPLSPVRAPTRLRELVERAWADPRLSRVKGDVVLALEVAPTDAVLVDREHAAYAIVNVLDNALVAMGGHGTLRLRCEPGSMGGRSCRVLEVRDEGPGMDRQVLEKAREPFFTTRPAGTGLGLAIVERVMRGHEGALEIQSEPGAGTAVRLLFPAWEGGSEPALAAAAGVEPRGAT